ncbi:LOW QUALITY PROTEIN: ribosome biogenesis protein NOP53 [Thrips palmi]|uniref:Ribosome biogenesis protein NOP53 n=1 Tax=Thrips palmi TaxID=161013 RepID=A0A6P8YXD2_THRPL|nr:LOW QUALITY PROTEIN: ribosome biogenesis protein NOP53 [Thrips palmi]
MAVTKVKKRQGSKKTKKAWRKTDIRDVEEFLEDKRLEERLGVSFKDSKDEDLFTVDTAPDSSNLEKYEGFQKERRNKIASQPPRCFANLKSDSKVPDPIAKRNRVRTDEERKHPVLRLKEAELKSKGILKAKEITRIRSRQYNAQQKRNKPKPGDFSKDLWDEDKPLPGEMNSEWVLQPAKEHNIANSKLKEMVIRYSKRSKPSKIAAIESPHPGVSYNPSFSAHTELLQAIANKEMELIKKDKHIKRVTSNMFQRIPREQAEADWMKEMSQGVPVLDAEAAKPDEEPTDNKDFKAINPPTNRDKKKDLKAKRKAREEKLKKTVRERTKAEKKKQTDLHLLKRIQKDLDEAQEKVNLVTQKRKAVREASVGTTRRLGPRKFEDRPEDFNLASDLKGSLRSIKPQGNLLADRFSSFQKRNMMHVPPAISGKSNRLKAKKVKRYKKASHKMEWEINPYERPGYLKKKQAQSARALGQK